MLILCGALERTKSLLLPFYRQSRQIHHATICSLLATACGSNSFTQILPRVPSLHQSDPGEGMGACPLPCLHLLSSSSAKTYAPKRACDRQMLTGFQKSPQGPETFLSPSVLRSQNHAQKECLGKLSYGRNSKK